MSLKAFMNGFLQGLGKSLAHGGLVRSGSLGNGPREEDEMDGQDTAGKVRDTEAHA